MRTLSSAARSVWAKSDADQDLSLPLHRHMADSAAVAGLLWDRWLPVSVRRLIGSDLAEGDARRLGVWMAAVHDLGKATPAFACQVPALAFGMHDTGLTMPWGVQVQGRSTCPHSTASHVLLCRWLKDEHGFSTSVASSYAVVPGGHHGVPPTHDDLDAADVSRLLGAGRWSEVQDELASFSAALADVTDLLPAWSTRPLPPTVQVLLTSLVVLADWIASDSARFPYDDPSSAQERAARAWPDLALTAPWRPGPPPRDVQALFQQRFALPDGAELRPVQRACVEAARDVDTPGLMLVEAPMGEGKTEAALAAAEVLAARTGAGGCFVALPTMATSDAMFGRVRHWVERLSAAGDVSLYLAHGKASLNEDFRDVVRAGRLHGVEQDSVDHAGRSVTAPETVAVALEWLSGRKKGVLSSFVVGTIDQVLVGALKSRHLVLRHLALASKVVVIDEAHASDAYMAVYLDAAVEWLGAYGVPTVVLSATLPPERRRALVAAYESGRCTGTTTASSPTGVVTRKRRRAPASAPFPEVAEATGYPLVTATTGGAPVLREVEPSGRGWSVQVEEADDDDVTLLALLGDALVDGGCAAVVRDTVDRAQQTAALLRRHYGEDVVLVHSRLLATDRADREATLRAELGPPGTARRPARRLVVGTQVLEQSLDVDFDLLVTDVAPLDLLLQRIGRLHRHERTGRPARLLEPRCVLVGVVDRAAAPPVLSGAAEAVYQRAPLLRALAVLREHLAEHGAVRLPEDIAPLVRKAYAETVQAPDTWREAQAQAQQQYEQKLDERRRNAGTFRLGPPPAPGSSLVGWLARGVGDADEDSAGGQSQVRDADETFEVVVVQRVDGEVRVLEWVQPFGGSVVETHAAPSDRLARLLATCTVRLPLSMSRPWSAGRVLDALEADGFAGWQTSPWLRGQLVLVLDEQLTVDVGDFRVRYSFDDGLVVDRLEGDRS